MNSTADDLAISVRDVNKTYGSTRALRGVNLSVRRGESHALLGRNGAGKSTLISVLTGLVTPDSGTVEIRSGGDDVQAAGADSIACVYQKSTLIDGLTSAENISLGNYPESTAGIVSWKRMKARAVELLEEWGYERLADVTVDQLQPLERKVVEVCRAMARGPRILLLDEPTAGLDEGASAELFAQIDAARARGVTVVYVSHHLDEIFRVCDAITILRDGTDVRESSVQDITVQGIVDELAGGAERIVDVPVDELAPQSFSHDGQVVLSVENARIHGTLKPTSLHVRRGESVGLTGLDGAGHVQLAQVIVGQLRADDGVVTVEGKAVKPGSTQDAIESGIGFVPEDRHQSGFAPELSIEENVTLPILRRISNGLGIVSFAARRRRYEELSHAWMIKASSPRQAVEELSGGNQQKVVLARALASDPSVLVLIHPTAGVDVTAKEAIYASIRALQAQGRAILIVSSDDDDLEICDRVEVMYRGAHHSSLGRGWTERELISSVQGATT